MFRTRKSVSFVWVQLLDVFIYSMYVCSYNFVLFRTWPTEKNKKRSFTTITLLEQTLYVTEAHTRKQSFFPAVGHEWLTIIIINSAQGRSISFDKVKQLAQLSTLILMNLTSLLHDLLNLIAIALKYMRTLKVCLEGLEFVPERIMFLLISERVFSKKLGINIILM